MLNEKEPLTREKFREKVYASEPDSIRDTEVDFLFDLLDYSKNEVIDKNDFPKRAEWAEEKWFSVLMCK